MFRCLVLTFALTRHELMTAIREAGCDEIDEMRVAFLENDDKISVIPKKQVSGDSPKEEEFFISQ